MSHYVKMPHIYLGLPPVSLNMMILVISPFTLVRTDKSSLPICWSLSVDAASGSIKLSSTVIMSIRIMLRNCSYEIDQWLIVRSRSKITFTWLTPWPGQIVMSSLPVRIALVLFKTASRISSVWLIVSATVTSSIDLGSNRVSWRMTSIFSLDTNQTF